MNPKTQTLVSALRVLSVEIQSEDGVANAVVAEAADRLTLMANLVARHIEETKKDTQEMKTACETMNGATETIQRLKDRIKQLEEALDLVRPHCSFVHHSKKHQHAYDEPCPVVALIEKAKEAKP